MIRHADYRAVADFKVVGSDYDAFFAKGRDFFMKVIKVDNHTVAHYAGNFGTKYARGKKIQDKFSSFVHDGVSRVVAALIPDDDIVILA